MKRELGQFYTTNVDYILDKMDLSNIEEDIIEPFVGNGDMKRWVEKRNKLCKEFYDIDPKIEGTLKRDTLISPPDYKDKFVITNPPYLARNKSQNKDIYNKYQYDDLYKIFIKTIIDGDVKGGIIIIPQGFLTSEDSKIKMEFFKKYKIIRVNFFEERVFDDTDYSICSIQFERGSNVPFSINFYPSQSEKIVHFNENNNWRYGGDIEIFKKKKGKYQVSRLLKGQTPNTNLYLHCVDTGSIDGKISLSLNEPYYGKLTDRVYATIVSNYQIPDEQYVVDTFNEKLNTLRKEYNSLFLTNFRNSSNEQARKRMGFGMAFTMIENILNEKWG